MSRVGRQQCAKVSVEKMESAQTARGGYGDDVNLLSVPKLAPISIAHDYAYYVSAWGRKLWKTGACLCTPGPPTY